MNFFQLLRSVAVVSVVTSGLTLATSFIFSLRMNKEGFGEYTYWYSIYLILLNLVQFGAVAAANVYRFQDNYFEYKLLMARTLFIVMPVMLLMVYTVFIVLDNVANVSRFSGLLYLAPVAAYFYINTLVLLSIYRIEQDVSSYAMMFISLAFVLFGVQVVVFYIYKSHYVVIPGFVFIQFIFYLYSLYVLKRRMGISLGLILNNRFDLSAVLDRLLYGYPLVLSSVSMSLLSMADRVYLKDKISTEDYGIYATITVVTSLMLFAVNNFAMAWGGYLIKRASGLNGGEIVVMFRRGQRFIWPIFFIGILVVVPILLGVHKLLYGDVGADFTIALILVSSGYLVYGLSKYYVGYMMAYKKNKDVLKATILGVSGMLLWFYVGILNEVVNASMALLLGFLIQFIYVYFFVNLKLSKEF
ncbi:MAG: oligosaccharide flippase family protein [Pseudomonadota bacterium]|nr:oligosaccharide flippase family protein [Pseudomonadota bacterium]